MILNFNVVKNYYQKKSKKHFLTILKSPHVNKSAQEQFDYHTFSKQLTVGCPNKHEQIYFLKKIKDNLFSDTHIKIKCSSNKKAKRNAQLQVFNPNNFKLNINNLNKSQQTRTSQTKENFSKQNNKKIKLFLQTLDIYGELIAK